MNIHVNHLIMVPFITLQRHLAPKGLISKAQANGLGLEQPIKTSSERA
ncbi:hypothetical protein QUF70_07700 [Desulfobacterales bacterium HSG17]|nr:hypothetical protein [Desulfobacterales bacterium HSG17]